MLDDLLAEWWASYRPAFDGMRVIGSRWSRASHDTREFLDRNLVGNRWLDVERDDAAASLLRSAGVEASALPVVVSPDASVDAQPGNARVAERIGLRTRAELPVYDLVIAGAGPAGLAAAVYGASEGLTTLVIERFAAGGQAGTSTRIGNYLGFPAGLSGADLAHRAVTQARRFGAELVTSSSVDGVELAGGHRVVRLSDGSQVNAGALLLATGVDYRILDVPGTEALTGAGVYYGAARTEAVAHRDQDVFVLGAANSAGEAALYLSSFARSVTVLVRRPRVATMSRYLVDQIEAATNISWRVSTTVAERAAATASRRSCSPDLTATSEVRSAGVFGEMALLSGDQRSATVTAMDDGEVLRNDAAALDQLLADRSVVHAMLATVVERLHAREALLLQRKNLTTLGRFAAGVLHNLNNPG